MITTLSSGGAEAMLAKFLLHASQNENFGYSVISLMGPGTYGPLLQERGIPLYCLHLNRPSGRLNGLPKLCALLKSERPHLMQTWLYHSDFLGLIIGRICGIPKIVWNIRCSDMDFRHYAFTTRSIFLLLSKLSHLPNAVIANSEAGRNVHIQAGYSPRRWEVIPNGFETEKYKPNPEARENFRRSLILDASIKLIGMVARYDTMKDHETFFAAAGRLSKICPNVRFVLAGRNVVETNAEIKNLIQHHGLNGRIYLLGERADLAEIYPAFDINTLSSSGEGFPNVLGEAMSCGVPCVATDVGDCALIIGDAGRVVPAKNPEALSQAWREILDMPALQRIEFERRARKRIIDNYSLSVAIQKYENLYFDLLK